ncbi:hypothetical protein PBI_IRONMAN_35 [Mycobacterium phage IronMan]|uniref:Uncharacterized protein n=1 Tax=Mycobacterium phage IronMan TaxID=2499042 RepID=A0A3S9UD52_9CAUD|nr:hypothetical protein KI247_gp66 [Mycobacterium phage IronMan]AZS08237.1 hypothetical protein PBI_IRONMAN_35 [Mycobacterium phage IronMan]
MNYFIPPEAKPKKPSPNPLFLVLAILSALPTAFFGLVFITSPSIIPLMITGWCGMWTVVWAMMANRYR